MDHDARVAADEDFLGLRAVGSGRFASLGACGVLKPDGLAGTFEERPEVSPPGEGALGFQPSGRDGESGWHTAVEVRTAETRRHPDPGPGRVCPWLRRSDGGPVTPAETEWILLDLRPDLAVGSYGHGIANVWTEDGHLLAVASQTASLMELDFDPLTAFGSHATELQERNR